MADGAIVIATIPRFIALSGAKVVIKNGICKFFGHEKVIKICLGRFLRSRRTQRERIFGGQQLKTIKDNFIFSPKWHKMIQKKIKNKNGELNEFWGHKEHKGNGGKDVGIQDGGMNRQQMSAYNADETDEEKTRSRNSRAQDIEGARRTSEDSEITIYDISRYRRKEKGKGGEKINARGLARALGVEM